MFPSHDPRADISYSEESFSVVLIKSVFKNENEGMCYPTIKVTPPALGVETLTVPLHLIPSSPI